MPQARRCPVARPHPVGAVPLLAPGERPPRGQPRTRAGGELTALAVEESEAEPQTQAQRGAPLHLRPLPRGSELRRGRWGSECERGSGRGRGGAPGRGRAPRAAPRTSQPRPRPGASRSARQRGFAPRLGDGWLGARCESPLRLAEAAGIALVLRCVLNRNGAPKSKLDKMWQRVFFCLQSINTTFKVRGGREKSNKYNLKMAVSQIFENIPQTLSHHLCGAVGSLGQASAIPRLHPAGMASSLERPQIFLL